MTRLQASLPASAGREWATMWPLPFVAMLGYSGIACFAYSIGVFMIPITHEFGWSRAAVSSAFTIQMLIGLVATPLIGRMTDRIGPRKIALAGILPFAIGLSCLAFTGHTITSWLLLCTLLAVLGAGVGPPVWVKPVVSRFKASRGIALAIVLAGIGVGGAIWPVLAAIYISHFGWRMAYPALALSWVVLALPLTYMFLFSAQDFGEKIALSPTPVATTGVFTSRTFISLALAGSCLSAITYGLTVHLVPILRENGFTLGHAAALAGLAGLSSILGRVVIGFLLDALPTRLVGTTVFLLPIVISLLLLNAHGSPLLLTLAVTILGFNAGGDADIVAYIVAKNFDQRVFGSIYAPMIALFSVGASIGPLLAGACYDWRGSYTVCFIAIMPIAVIAAMLVGTIPAQEFPRSGEITLTENEAL